MPKIIALGELLVDFTPAGKAQNPLFEFNPGGGVANFAVATAKMGVETQFVGQVGDDSFGKMLSQSIQSYGVDAKYLNFSKQYMTTLAFVHLFEDGDRDFTFYRKNGADAMLSEEYLKSIEKTLWKDCDVLHFSSLSLVNPTCKKATYYAAKKARENKILITYDPNWRPSLWESEQNCKQEMNEAVDLCDVVKVSGEELEYITEISNVDLAAKSLLDRGVKIVVLTLGSEGAMFFSKNKKGSCKPFAVKAVDATGAGDTCFGTFVAQIAQIVAEQKHKNTVYEAIETIDEQKLSQMLNFANAAAAISVTKRGGMPSIPTKGEVETFLTK